MGVLAITMLSSTFAQSLVTRTKPAWDWSLDERLAERFDRGSIHERALAYRPARGEILSQAKAVVDDRPGNASPQFGYLIDGRRNPELFLPHELFDMLLSGLTPDESLRAKQRASYQASLRSLGYDDVAFWNALASVSGEYLTIRFENSEEAFRQRCHARFEALQSARKLFGPAKFDRVLYTVIAPTAFTSATASHDTDFEAELRRNAQGCR
jgi:hypothetical protein